MKELFRKVKIKGFEHYQISNYGVLFNTKNARLTYGHEIKVNGALQFSLSDNNRNMAIMAHLLVLRHFKKEELDKTYGLHIDGDLENNNSRNLKWSTLSEVFRAAHARRAKKRGVYEHQGNKGEKCNFKVMLRRDGKLKTIAYTKTKEQGYNIYFDHFVKEFGYKPW